MTENNKRRVSTVSAVQVGLFAALIAICAQITLPVLTVPVTLQVFGVALTLLLLGGKSGTLAVLVYLLLGAFGAPVFAGFGAGFGVLTGVTGGYLWGFLLMAIFYWMTENGVPEKGKSGFWTALVRLIPGLLLCYATGTLQFSWVAKAAGNEKSVGAILLLCVIPYVLPDFCKLFLAYRLATAIRKTGILRGK